MRVFTITILEEDDGLGPLEVHMTGPHRVFPIKVEADELMTALPTLQQAIINADIRWSGIPD